MKLFNSKSFKIFFFLVSLINVFLHTKKITKNNSKEPSNLNVLKRYLLNNSNAKCLDGSPYAVYYTPGYDSGKNKIIINFWGASWVHGRNREEFMESALNRLKTDYGSSKNWKKKDTYGYSFLGGEESKNKHFFNWNRFDFIYCDGSIYQGHVTDPIEYKGKKLYFRGFDNVLAGINFMFERIKIEEVDMIVLSGCSSGGAAAILWTQYFADFVKNKNKNTAVLGISQGGYFIDYKNLKTKDHDTSLKYKQLY